MKKENNNQITFETKFKVGDKVKATIRSRYTSENKIIVGHISQVTFSKYIKYPDVENLFENLTDGMIWEIIYYVIIPEDNRWRDFCNFKKFKEEDLEIIE